MGLEQGRKASGKANPDLGSITLITPPTQTENKHALQQFLVKRYRPIAMLNQRGLDEMRSSSPRVPRAR